MKQEIRERLQLLAEKEYRDFSAALVPGEKRMLGVRLPKLREMAKQLAKGNWMEQLETEDVYFEELMLRGMLIGYGTLKMNPREALVFIREFVPCVNNWSVCDSVFMKMDILKKDKDLTWEFILPYLDSGREFEVRIALVVMMAHLLRCDADGRKISRLKNVTLSDLSGIEEEKKTAGKYLYEILDKIDRPFTEGYYAHMAAAWLVAESFCCFPATTIHFLRNCQLDDATYNKALQKIVESKIPEEDVKSYIRKLKNKNGGSSNGNLSD